MTSALAAKAVDGAFHVILSARDPKQKSSRFVRAGGNLMQHSKKIADLSLSFALILLFFGIFYLGTRETPTSSSENLSLTLLRVWGFTILGLCALSLLARAHYVFVERPRELLYQLYPSVLALLPFVFYWQVN